MQIPTLLIFSLLISTTVFSIRPKSTLAEDLPFNSLVEDLDLGQGENIFNSPHKKPEFPNGDLGLKLYLLENNPINDRNITGLVYVKFVVQKTGLVSNVEVLNSNNKALNEDAIDLVRAMPKWHPGTKAYGDSVNTHMLLPISFKYQSHKASKIEALQESINEQREKASKKITDEESEDPFTVQVESEPEFPAGAFALSLFIRSNLKIENVKEKHRKTASVTIACVIQANGEITDAKIKDGANKSLNQEALRLVSLMPNWVPARQGGKSINVEYSIPINFNAILFN